MAGRGRGGRVSYSIHSPSEAAELSAELCRQLFFSLEGLAGEEEGKAEAVAAVAEAEGRREDEAAEGAEAEEEGGEAEEEEPVLETLREDVEDIGVASEAEAEAGEAEDAEAGRARTRKKRTCCSIA